MSNSYSDSLSSFVQIKAVTKTFGNVIAVDEVSLDIAKGSFFSLLGPSGCGKTTLMRLLAGFEQPDSGEMRIAGETLGAMPPHQRPVNMMFQNYALFPHMSVRNNVAFGLKQMKLPALDVISRTDGMLSLVQLEGLADRKPHELSGGQKQRVALARALARQPKILLLDEPLGALDKGLRKETQAELKRIQNQLGTTFIVVTHDQEEAMALSDRIAVMRAGQIVQVGSPLELYQEPASLFVAGFLGEINSLPVSVISTSGANTIVQSPDLDQSLTLPFQSGAGQESTLVVRPEHFLPVAKPDQALENRISVTVIDKTYLGSMTSYTMRTKGGTRLTVAVAARPAHTDFAPGDEAVTGFRTSDARLLPP